MAKEYSETIFKILQELKEQKNVSPTIIESKEDVINSINEKETPTTIVIPDNLLEKNTDFVVGEFINKIKNDPEFEVYLKSIEKNDAIISAFLSPGKTIKEETPTELIVLRQWNSYTPILPNGKILNKGGGYFVCHKGKGIVIDPGYNFIEHFFDAGFKIDDIDYVFVTHAHDDHTGQLEGIFSLLYKRNRKEETKHKINLYLNVGTFKKFAPVINLTDKESIINKLIILNEHHEYQIDENIWLYPTRVQHHEIISSNYALGLTFKFIDDKYGNRAEKVVRFTGDTGWNNDVELSNREFLQDRIERIDLLVLHLGSIKKHELLYDKSKSMQANNDYLYENHLGLIGAIAMIHSCKSDLSIISEFGIELDEVRIKVAELINSEFKSLPVIAADVNLRVKVFENEVRDSVDHKYYNPNDISTQRKLSSELVYISKDKLTGITESRKQSLISEAKMF